MYTCPVFNKKTRGAERPAGKELWDKRYELLRSWQMRFTTTH